MTTTGTTPTLATFPNSDIVFFANNKEVMRIKDGSFIAMGKEIKDTKGVYKMLVKFLYGQLCYKCENKRNGHKNSR